MGTQAGKKKALLSCASWAECEEEKCSFRAFNGTSSLKLKLNNMCSYRSGAGGLPFSTFPLSATGYCGLYEYFWSISILLQVQFIFLMSVRGWTNAIRWHEKCCFFTNSMHPNLNKSKYLIIMQYVHSWWCTICVQCWNGCNQSIREHIMETFLFIFCKWTVGFLKCLPAQESSSTTKLIFRYIVTWKQMS